MEPFALDDHPHRRQNLLTGEWVLVSPHRTRRPWRGQVEKPPPDERPAYDPTCYLCPGNERAGGARRALVGEFPNVEVAGTLTVSLDLGDAEDRGDPLRHHGFPVLVELVQRQRG